MGRAHMGSREGQQVSAQLGHQGASWVTLNKSISGLHSPHPYKEGFEVGFWALKWNVTKRLFKINKIKYLLFSDDIIDETITFKRKILNVDEFLKM